MIKQLYFQLLRRTAGQVIASEPTAFKAADITPVQLAYAERQSELPHISRSAVPVIIPDTSIKRSPG